MAGIRTRLSFIIVLVTCKFGDDTKTKMRELFYSQHFLHYKSMGIKIRRSRAGNSETNGPNWPEIELIRYFMTAFVT